MIELECIQNQVLVHYTRQLKIPDQDETLVTLRPFRGRDAVLIMDLHDRLSNECGYYRYLSANKPKINNIQDLFSSNGEAGKAIVATVETPPEKVIALAYYRVNPDEPSTAEPAVLVEDNYQGRGLGKQIIIALYQIAIQEGQTSFDMFIHPANYRVFQIIKSSGLQIPIY